MTRQRQRVGVAGESAARRYLQKGGYRVVKANYRCLYGEIDLIVTCGELLVFVEVRTRTSGSFGTPAQSITAEKLDRLQKVALYYMQQRFGQEVPCRFDLIAVQMDRRTLAPSHLRHYRNITG